MRNLTVIAFILFVVCHFEVVSQPCLPDGITFTNQSQIDSFQILHPNCTEIEGDVYIFGDDITNLDGLTVLTDIEGNLSIGEIYSGGNPILNSLSGLENVTTIGGYLLIEHNPDLTSLEGVEGVTTIGGYLWIDNNPDLTSLEGLEGVTSIGGHLMIYANYALTSLAGWVGVTSIGGHLRIYSNYALTSLTGLESVNSIGGSLLIEDNPALTSLAGLEGVTSIAGYIRISSNDTLTSLAGLENIESNSVEDLQIYHNQNLSTCEVKSICDYLISPNGVIEIHDNAPGCNNQQEVEDACTVGISEQQSASQLSVHPNPFTTSITIEYELTEPSHVQLTIYNLIGEVVNTTMDRMMPQGKHTFTWSPERLPEGMYYCVLRSEDGVRVVKMVKQ